MYGLHFAETLGGRTFCQTGTPLGLALPIYTATAVCGAGVCGMPLWNKPNSNVVVELVSVDVNYGSGTADYGAVVLMAAPLDAVATGALCTAFAPTTPINMYLGGGQSSKVLSSNGVSAVTVTAGTAGAPSSTAPGVVRSLADFNLEAQTGTAHGTGVHTYSFNGTIAVPPGQLVYLAATKASVALFCTAFVWKEHFANAAIG